MFHSVNPRIVSVALAVSLVFSGAAISAASSPVRSANDLEVAEAHALLENLVPEVLTETASDTSPVDLIVEPTTNSDPGGADTITGPKVAIDDLNTDEISAEGVEFTIDYATDLIGEQDGISSFATNATDVSALVQPTNIGARVITIIGGPDSPTSYDYTFDVPVGTEFLDADGIYYLIGD
ncbi:hypothetical protein V5R04_01550 [Jonesiaceae bacterium BS-20]|uniref:Uncharacterized protein n=1 Tax=Jonesiaceae bacterium BS-20 TaxID=3120821 RepID=A0AAU7DX64_9MICO